MHEGLKLASMAEASLQSFLSLSPVTILIRSRELLERYLGRFHSSRVNT